MFGTEDRDDLSTRTQNGMDLVNPLFGNLGAASFF